jgi:microcystin-dependent protein
MATQWMRWNPTTHIFEYSTDGVTFAPMPLNASVINEGVLSSSVVPASGGGVPAGAIMAFGGTIAPTGFLLCTGALVSRSTYAALFAAIGIAYGAGDGSTTFGLPDLQQKFPLGKAAAGTGVALGSVGGAIDHTHAIADHLHTVPAHTHPLSGSAAADSVNTFSAVGSGTLVSRSTHVHTVTGTATAQTAMNTGGSGVLTSDAKNPPYQVVNYIIKT